MLTKVINLVKVKRRKSPYLNSLEKISNLENQRTKSANE
jgi:hypothetical protein